MKHRLAAVALIMALVGGLATAAYTAIRAPDSEAIPQFPPSIERDLDQILERDTLIALTSYGSTSYFLWKGEPFGFEYELLNDFGTTHDVVVRMRVVPRDSLLPMLNRGVGDIVAAGLIPSDVDTARFRYTDELYRTRPVVVQRGLGTDSARVPTAQGAIPADTQVLPPSIDTIITPEQPAVPEPFRIRARPVQRVAELGGRRIHVQEDHPYIERLIELHVEVAGDIRIVEVDTTTENLIRRVASGRIDLTVAPENIAVLEESYYSNLLVRPAIGRPHAVTWAVRANSPRLRAAIDAWIERTRGTREFDSLYEGISLIDRRSENASKAGT